jgi:UDP-N-acetylmuramoylalanine--D-glutamate ligase
MTPWERFKKDWKGKKVLIMGLGLQGRGIGDAKIFCEAGSQVTVTDLKNEAQLQSAVAQLKGFPVRFVLGIHEEEDFRSHDLVLRNPDVPKSSPFLKIAIDAGVAIRMDSSLFAGYCPLPIIGITGTRGKTTTTMMTYEVLKKLFPGPVYLGGNVPGKATLELLGEIEEPQKYASFGSWSTSTHPKSATSGFGRTGDFFRRKKSGSSEKGIVVLELSSWELQGWHDEKISPHISVFTNFYQDHLNRYASMDEYFKDKLSVAEYQSSEDWLVAGPEVGLPLKGLKANVIRFSGTDLPQNFRLQIPGDHNRDNAAAVLKVTGILGLKEDKVLEILSKFTGVPYRLETIAVIDGVEYINDTTSTTPAAGIAALRAMVKPLILIAGGSSKKLDLKPFTEEIVKKVKHVIFLKGEGTDEILVDIASLDPSARRRLLAQDDTNISAFDDFRKSIEKARELAKPGDVVLLSPGCASFSMFKNEFDRGDQFNQIVRKWQKK